MRHNYVVCASCKKNGLERGSPRAGRQATCWLCHLALCTAQEHIVLGKKGAQVAANVARLSSFGTAKNNQNCVVIFKVGRNCRLTVS